MFSVALYIGLGALSFALLPGLFIILGLLGDRRERRQAAERRDERTAEVIHELVEERRAETGEYPVLVPADARDVGRAKVELPLLETLTYRIVVDPHLGQLTWDPETEEQPCIYDNTVTDLLPYGDVFMRPIALSSAVGRGWVDTGHQRTPEEVGA